MQYQTIERTAAQLAVNPRTIRRMIARGELRAVRVGRVIRIDASSIEAGLRPIPTA